MALDVTNTNIYQNAQDDPTRANARMVLAEMGQLDNRLPSLFNPEQLQLSIGVTVGRLKPIGWSHPVKMYGCTDEWQLPINLHFSQFGIWARGYKYPSIGLAMDWLSQFCYSKSIGRAPGKLVVLWPNVLTMGVNVDSMGITHTQFDKELNTRMTEVALQTSEIRVQFKDAYTQQRLGFTISDENVDISGKSLTPLLGGAGTGRPMNLGGANRR